jgi:hypothetical protein
MRLDCGLILIKLEGFFKKKASGLPDLGRPCARSDGWERAATWPRSAALFWCVNRMKEIILKPDFFIVF